MAVNIIDLDILKSYLELEMDDSRDKKLNLIVNEVNRKINKWVEAENLGEVQYSALMYAEYLYNIKQGIKNYNDTIESYSFVEIDSATKIPNFIYNSLEEYLNPKFRIAKGLIK